MVYQHINNVGERLPYTVGKAVCIGQNYEAHRQEMSGPVTKEAVLFIKSANAFYPLESQLPIPMGRGDVHHELELVLLIQKPLKSATAAQLNDAVYGYALGLDLTLRTLQASLKKQGLPWERAKSFDHSAIIGGFTPINDLSELNNLELKLIKNGQVQQLGNTQQMIRSIEALLIEISANFSLQPGDVVFTGTPAGVSALAPADQLELCVGQNHASIKVVSGE